MSPAVISILIQILIGVGLQVVGYLLMPKPKTESPTAAEFGNPTVDAGRPVPVVFGEVQITGVNVLWYGDKETYGYEV